VIGHSVGVRADVRGRREQRLWPLVVVAVVGVLIVGGVIIAASRSATRMREQPAESRLLDSLTIDARLVTLPGTREVSLTRYAVCPRGDDNSAATRVDRDLRLPPNVSVATAQAEILSGYARLGWMRDSHDMLGTLDKDTRSLDISGSVKDSHDLVVSVSFAADVGP
jgi:hypothetical protein